MAASSPKVAPAIAGAEQESAADDESTWVAHVPKVDTLSPALEEALERRYDSMDTHIKEQQTMLQKLMESQRVIEEQQAKALVCECV